jgi:hypothetical protein
MGSYTICVLLFAGLYYSSLISGYDDAKRDFIPQNSTLFKVKFVLKDVGDESKKDTAIVTVKSKNTPAADEFLPEDIAADLKEFNEKEQLKLLLSTKEVYMVLVSDTLVTDSTYLERDRTIYTIKKDDVKLTRIIK